MAGSNHLQQPPAGPRHGAAHCNQAQPCRSPRTSQLGRAHTRRLQRPTQCVGLAVWEHRHGPVPVERAPLRRQQRVRRGGGRAKTWWQQRAIREAAPAPRQPGTRAQHWGGRLRAVRDAGW